MGLIRVVLGGFYSERGSEFIVERFYVGCFLFLGGKIPPFEAPDGSVELCDLSVLLLKFVKLILKFTHYCSLLWVTVK